MRKQFFKYILSSVLLIGFVWEVMGVPNRFVVPTMSQSIRQDSLRYDSLRSDSLKRSRAIWDSLRFRNMADTLTKRHWSDSLGRRLVTDSMGNNFLVDTMGATTAIDNSFLDSIFNTVVDTTKKDSLNIVDSLPPIIKKKKEFLDAPLFGKNSDSLIYDMDKKMIYVHGEGDVQYQDMGLQADFTSLDTEKKIVKARGKKTVTPAGGSADGKQGADAKSNPVDSTSKTTYKKPVFKQGGAEFEVDSVDYGMNSQKAFIHGVQLKEAESEIDAEQVKREKDGVLHMHNGHYTTCDAECKHFYMVMTKGTIIPNKKTIFGPSYMVFEDVPLYFFGVPFGFFPQMSDKGNSGFIIPEIGEEYVKGFFLRNGGYYFLINQNVDLRVTAGIYTLGSWEVNASSNYTKRYKYRGGVAVNYGSNVIGEVGATDYVNNTAMHIVWNHSQDPKASPGSTFSASVDFSTSSYNKYNSQSLNEYLNSSASSSIAYQKSWAGTPFSLSMNGRLSQDTKDAVYEFNLPVVNFNVATVYPFKKKIAMGKERWYEKINFTYTFNFNNTTGRVKEKDLFSPEMFNNMIYGVDHSLPIRTSMNLFQYLNISPSFNYRESWNFKKVEQYWDSEKKQSVMGDTTKGFNRVYRYDISLGFNTNLYGMYTMGREEAKSLKIRHVFTPSISLSYVPGFKQFWRTIETDDPERPYTYSPYQSAPSRDPSANLNFSFNNTLEMKLPKKNPSDTTEAQKVKLIEGLSVSSGYNFIADSLKLREFDVSFRTTLFKKFAINVSSKFDPYQIDDKGNRINKFQINKGAPARLISIGTSFSYTFSGGKQGGDSGNKYAVNNPETMGERNLKEIQEEDFFNQSKPGESQVDRARMAAGQYYDFSIPWSLGFSYTINYTKPANTVNLTQTLSFNGNVNVTDKWAASFTGGYDFKMNKISHASVQISRDLHCWQMSFNWVPLGHYKSWSFSIRATSSMLTDLLKWDKHNSHLDNLYGY